MANDPKRVLGNIQFQGKDIPAQTFQYDRIAIDSRQQIMLLSVVAETQAVKAIRAILNGGAKADIQASGGKVQKPNAAWGYSSNPGRITPTSESYACYTQKLEYGMAHALFVTRMPGFMPVMTPDALWQELCETRFTTPILREWLPWIESRLTELGSLDLCESFNFPYPCKDEEGNEAVEVMRCGVLTANTEKLDEVVTEGLRNGEITIPGPAGSNLDLPKIEILEGEPGEKWSEPEPPAGPKSWVVTDYSGCYYSTKEMAEAVAEGLMGRWNMARSFTVEPSDHEPNY